MTPLLYGWGLEQWMWAAEAYIRATHAPPFATGLEGLTSLQHWYMDRHSDEPAPRLVLVGGAAQTPIPSAHAWVRDNFYRALADPSVFRALRYSKEHA